MTPSAVPNEAKQLIGLEGIPWNPGRMNLFPNTNETTGPRGTLSCDCKRIFTRQQIAQIRAKTHYVYIGLEIQYWDTLVNGEHRTRNYFRLDGSPWVLQRHTLEAEEGIVVDEEQAKQTYGFTIIPGLSMIT